MGFISELLPREKAGGSKPGGHTTGLWVGARTGLEGRDRASEGPRVPREKGPRENTNRAGDLEERAFLLPGEVPPQRLRLQAQLSVRDASS